ncbi:DUF5686 and carboxypeptidase-like regulatory domain-containing protein [Mucilaginibacter sp. OK098]|uniref:DUF5686 and carboxypeptidase-like regulatory domain-containing protein n=1 Tax=Mucilaginibacter sp. OK098 TaxID=1855297 RepID=UPI0009241AC7|nr:DUF5686 and carboxypeptidase-like regulatory domain-containing protein [Mucilaginibacter sp. OK098]SHN25111.1 CarboxypepD_reg-like domain-containing protein [Mucilaginibacter sp. OK098]
MIKLFAGSLLFLSILLLGSQQVIGQKVIIKGKITDAKTGEPVTYATIGVKGTEIGTSTNFDGFFKLEFIKKSDSITVSCIGYLQQSFLIGRASVQTINIQLKPSSQSLNEVRITPKGYMNPAWAILKEMVKHKPVNDPRSIKSYQLESYSRIELDASNFSSNLLKKKFIQQAISMADSMKIAGVDNMPVLPLFLSETVSDFFYQSNPEAKREDIKKTKTNGVGFEDGALLAQLTGSTFQQYNFYKNFVSAAGKEFASPISDGWKNWYDYELENRNAIVDGKTCYQISFKPKRSRDLAFTGTIWIAQENYALYQIKATIEPSANLNFIHRISVQQQMDGKTPDRPWLPVKTRILVEVEQLSSNSSGLLAKFYTVNKIINTDGVYPPDFFKDNITVDPDARQSDNHFWDMNRPDSLTNAEKSVYSLIDTVKTLPTIKNYLTAADLLINGYYRAGNISLGPFLNTYSYNNVEGNRIRLGFKTNSDFDKKWILGGYVAYGSKDLDVKYGASIDYILSRKHWTEAGISFTHDLNQVALLSDNYLYQRNNLFSAFTRFGRIDKRKVFDQDLLNFYVRRDLFKGFTEKISFSQWSLDPLFQFNFNDPKGGISQQLFVSEFQFETKWSPGVQPLISETINRPVSIKTDVSKPEFTFRYTLGLKNLFGSDVTYHKFSFNITQTLKMGSLGRGKYSFSSGYIPSSVPFPLLENHLGNTTFIYNPNAFNLMRFFEFASDKYASLSYTQHFEGLLLNTIPVIKNFKWRLVGTANILYGSISQTNQNNILDRNTLKLQGLGTTPYVEAGYGIENIFKFFRVDFIHRLTYRDNNNALNGSAKNFGIKISAQIRL